MMIFFVIFAVMITLFLQKRAMEKGFDALTADHTPDKRLVEVDELFYLEIAIRNQSKTIIPFVKAKEHLSKEFNIDERTISVRKDYRGIQSAEFTAWLYPNQELKRSVPVSVSQRGRYVLNDLTLQYGDFLGLKEESKTCGRFNEIVVAPKAMPMDGIEEVFGGFMGDMSARRFIFEDPILTLGYSEYTGREPMRMISWTQSARRNALLVKKSDYTLEAAVSVILNVDANLPDKNQVLEKCFSMARTVCGMLEKRGVKYSFVSNAMLAGGMGERTSSEEGLGMQHYASVLEHLGRATYECHMSIDRLLQQEIRRQTSAGRILITPGGAETETDLIGRLRETAGGNLLVLCGKETLT